jgi:hypothetical protein
MAAQNTPRLTDLKVAIVFSLIMLIDCWAECAEGAAALSMQEVKAMNAQRLFPGQAARQRIADPRPNLVPGSSPARKRAARPGNEE